jgi:16S rRNA (guanine(966)-N(2))-methyltransferase RsmD
MRITGGVLRGRQISCPKGIIRPAMDKMRESVFAVLLSRLAGASFLDLFSGSGIIGLEAWSRGAAPVVLVEKDPVKRRVLTENAALAEGGATVHIMPVERYVKFAREGPFDFVFLDPPFAYRFKAQLLDMLDASGLLAEGGAVIIHHPREDALPETAGGLVQTGIRTYGRSVVRFYTKG